MRDFGTLTLRVAQQTQPWTVPYNAGIDVASRELVPHILGSHTALHVAKSAGKLASVFEKLDHSRNVGEEGKSEPLTPELAQEIKDMSADLVTAAMRFANLYGFDLAEELVRRSEDKNRVTLSW